MNILIVRYAQGAAGKFLMSLLMGSADVAHYDQKIEANKNTNTLMEYIKRSFKDLDNWLTNEPNPIPVWNLYWISAKMPRGEDQTYTEWLTKAQEEASAYFWDSVKQNKVILLQINKSTLPLAYQDCKSVAIVSDPKGLKFNRKAVWYKHYAVVDDKIHIKNNDPKYTGGGATMSKIITQFNNPIFSEQSVLSYYRNNIWSNETLKYFSDPTNFRCPKINLSSILDNEKIYDAVVKLCNDIDITPPDKDYVNQAHQHWINLHNFKH